MWYTLDNSQGCESLPCLQEQEVDCSEESCLDGVRFAQSRLADSNGMSFSPGKETEFSIGSRSGTTCVHSTEDSGAERSTSSAEVSPVRTSAAQGEDSELSAENGVDYGANTQGSFARYDRDSCSWKTAQCSLFGGLESFSGTWPKQGMMLHGRCYPLVIAAHRTSESGCGLSERFPTPTVFENNNRKGMSPRSGDGLSTYVKKWPTPTCHTANHSCMRDKTKVIHSKNRSESLGLCAEVYRRTDLGDGGHLNPDWIEWLMGWPIGWTALKPLETDRFRLWLHGRFAN